MRLYKRYLLLVVVTSLLTSVMGALLSAQDKTGNEAKRELERIKNEWEWLCLDYNGALKEAKSKEEKELIQKKLPQFKKYVMRCIKMVERWPEAPESFDALLWVHQSSRYGNEYYRLDDPALRPRIVELLDHHFFSKYPLDEISKRLHAQWVPNNFGFHTRVMDRIKKEGENHRVIPLLIWIERTGNNSAVDEPVTIQARNLLHEKYLKTREIGEWCNQAFSSTRDSDLPFLRLILKDNPHDDVKARACLALGKRLLPWSDTEAEGVACLERVLRDFKNIDGNSKARARRELNSMRYLIAEGKAAPEIDGVDLFDKPLKLSDYRGKVVLLSFWGFWCRPCMALVPYEQSLVKRLQGKPFALLGVNTIVRDEQYDDSFKQKLVKHQMTWRSFKDNRPLDGSIHTEWCLQVHPSMVLIDHKGVIRKIWNGSPGEEILDGEIDKLVKLAEGTSK